MNESTDPQSPDASPQYTAGPWYVSGPLSEEESGVPGGRSRDVVFVDDETGETLGLLDDVTEGNANLIAAAPKMLAACQAVVRWAKEAEQRGVKMPLWCGLLWDEAIKEVNNAIAQAEGRDAQ